MDRDRRTIEREISRGSVIQRDSEWRDRVVYCADAGQRVKEENSSNKGRGLKIGHDHKLAAHMEKKIGEEQYSPDVVIGEIKAKGLAFETMLCIKTLYNYIDANLFANISNKDLPIKRNGKKRKYGVVRGVALNNLKGRSIEERDAAVELREEAGHWEMDCVVGKGKACLLVLTERASRMELIFKMSARTQDNVVAVLDQLEWKQRGKFSDIFKSITMDNGGEFLASTRLETSSLVEGKTRTKVFYAHPYSAWERESNENANKLIRRFVPKGMDIGKLTNKAVKRIELWVNNYPRRLFDYRAANDMYAA